MKTNFIHHKTLKVFLLSSAVLSGCVVKDELFLQNVDVEGSLVQPPLHIVEADMHRKVFHVSPHISVSIQFTNVLGASI